MKKKIIALIPARSGSKRVKNKNIKSFFGHPLIAYSINLAKSSKLFDRVIVSTDSNKYAKIAKNYGAEVPFLRPKKLSSSKSVDYDWIRFTLDNLEISKLNYDYYCLIRPTSPFRSINMLEKAAKLINAKRNADSLRAVELCSQHPYKMWKINKGFMNSFVNYKLNHQPGHSVQYASLPDIYVQNASLEITKIETIYKYNNITGKKIIPFITNGFEGYDINSNFDWLFAKMLVEKKIVKLRKI